MTESPNPEQVIRRYLDANGGQVRAHVRHLQVTFEVEELNDEGLERISEALATVGVSCEPRLTEVGSSGALTLYVSKEEPSPQEIPQDAQVTKPRRRSGFFRRREDAEPVLEPVQPEPEQVEPEQVEEFSEPAPTAEAEIPPPELAPEEPAPEELPPPEEPAPEELP